jgi:xanthine dehydrogenase accessory factor
MPHQRPAGENDLYNARVDVLAEAARLGRAGTPAALATVLRTAGSTPRHAAAKMVVGTAGVLAGTIGGGRIELEVTEAARAVAAGGAPARIERHLVHDLAMCCGGKMDVYVEPLDAARWRPLAEAARRRARRMPCALVTALDGSGKDVVDADDVLRARRPRLEDGRFIEPVLPTDRLILFGAGHVARALAPLAAGVGFEIVVCDEDERFATADRFPGAQLVPSFDAREVAQALAPLGDGDHVLIVTRDHAVDRALLEQLLPETGLTYLGLIGSRGKIGRFRNRLEAKGLADDALWARLHAPVGLDIGAETPEEIAVAIVAELIQVRHAR